MNGTLVKSLFGTIKNLTKDTERMINSGLSKSARKQSYLGKMKTSCEDWRRLTQSNTWDTNDKQKSVKINVKWSTVEKNNQIFIDGLRAAC